MSQRDKLIALLNDAQRQSDKAATAVNAGRLAYLTGRHRRHVQEEARRARREHAAEPRAAVDGSADSP